MPHTTNQDRQWAGWWNHPPHFSNGAPLQPQCRDWYEGLQVFPWDATDHPSTL